jgi:uncharacterized protein YcfJ
MKRYLWLGGMLAASMGLLAACSDSQSANTATGALIGAAAGQAVGSGTGRVAATLVGAAVGAQVGANQPTSRTCTYRNSETGELFQAPCP